MHYQLCPKCNGQGTLSKPPYIPGDVYQWTTSQASFTCDVCNGSKVLLVPDEVFGEVLKEVVGLSPYPPLRGKTIEFYP